MKKNYLTGHQRKQILRTLSDFQRNSLFSSLSLTYSSMIGNALAGFKGTLNWRFIRYLDHGEISDYAKCVCGRKLRFEYVMQHVTTKEIRSLGIEHFKEELKIPDEIATAVLNCRHTIHYDLDEILIKIKSGWKTPIHLLRLVEDTWLEKDSKLLYDAELPLLDRHMNKLYDLVRKQKVKHGKFNELLNRLESETGNLEFSPIQQRNLAEYITNRVFPIYNVVRLPVTYLITKQKVDFQLFEEINLSTKWHILRYGRTVLEDGWLHNHEYENVRYSSYSPVGCIARIDKLPDDATGLLIFFDKRPFPALAKVTRAVLTQMGNQRAK